MKKLLVIGLALAMTGCISLSHREKNELRYLASNGIDMDYWAAGFEAPKSPALAGTLNLLPGVGNVYLGLGSGGETVQFAFGVVNFFLWPLSIFWGVPQAAIDAHTQNKREMLNFYRHNPYGIEELQRRGLELK